MWCAVVGFYVFIDISNLCSLLNSTCPGQSDTLKRKSAGELTVTSWRVAFSLFRSQVQVQVGDFVSV